MDTIQILLITVAVTVVLGMAALVLVASAAEKAFARRLEMVRLRHSESVMNKAEAQIRRALASRQPKLASGDGPVSRIDALALRLHRTGKGWSVRSYVQASAGLGLGLAALIFLKTGVFPLALAVGLAAGAGLPHLVVGYLINKRYNDFTAKFPDAIELLVRGLKSGLPIAETLSVVSSEVPGAVGQEFKLVTERIRIGRSMDEALQETANRLNMAEFNFFSITIAIQRETGGNLAETLANLADVLRKRAQMKLKIKAMSSESKASAYIVGSLPFMVFIMIQMVNPQYLAGFFSETRLMIAGAGGLLWMGIGVFIMAKMVSFEI